MSRVAPGVQDISRKWGSALGLTKGSWPGFPSLNVVSLSPLPSCFPSGHKSAFSRLATKARGGWDVSRCPLRWGTSRGARLAAGRAAIIGARRRAPGGCGRLACLGAGRGPEQRASGCGASGVAGARPPLPTPGGPPWLPQEFGRSATPRGRLDLEKTRVSPRGERGPSPSPALQAGRDALATASLHRAAPEASSEDALPARPRLLEQAAASRRRPASTAPGSREPRVAAGPETPPHSRAPHCVPAPLALRSSKDGWTLAQAPGREKPTPGPRGTPDAGRGGSWSAPSPRDLTRITRPPPHPAARAPTLPLSGLGGLRIPARENGSVPRWPQPGNPAGFRRAFSARRQPRRAATSGSAGWTAGSPGRAREVVKTIKRVTHALSGDFSVKTSKGSNLPGPPNTALREPLTTRRALFGLEPPSSPSPTW